MPLELYFSNNYIHIPYFWEHFYHILFYYFLQRLFITFTPGYYLIFILFCFLETGSHYVPQTWLKVSILLSQPPECGITGMCCQVLPERDFKYSQDFHKNLQLRKSLASDRFYYKKFGLHKYMCLD
jgi:hypothetical protein